MKMKIKLIALDLDGTFLKHGNVVSEANRNAVLKAVSEGITVVISTGRVFGEIPPSVKEIEGISYYITSNGGAVLDAKGKLIYENPLVRETSDGIMKILRKYDCLLDLYIAGKAYIRNFDESELPHYGLSSKDFDTFRIFRNFVDDINEFYESCPDRVEKINMFFGDTDERERAIRELGELNPVPQLTYSMGNNLEVNSADCTKGKALSELCKKLGIFPVEVMAAGDSNNDVTMLDYAGVSVAMGNAPQFVKNYAKYETDSCENDGVAKAIEKYAL